MRSTLHRLGLRFRKDLLLRLPDRRARPDVLFVRRRVAVFVDGCIWHGCLEHGTSPRANSDYWLLKLERNAKRDRMTDRSLSEAGWRVVRVWEHEDPAEAARRVSHVVRSAAPR
ncbi:MAG: DNA mismatch endonuclease Vsr [bacterium]